MIKYMEKLYKKYLEINKLGWIEVSKNHKGISGIKFEELLGISPENFEIPDFYGIEIKVKSNSIENTMTLFSATPDSYLFEIKRLINTYGYPDKNFPQFKVLQTTVFTNKLKHISNKYYFKLYVDYKNEKVVLIVLNNILNIIDKKTSWSFSMLKEKLERKLTYLCLVNAKKMEKNEKLYFKYEKITFYKLKSFETFIDLIDKGKIKIKFNINIYKDEKNLGKIYDHGTSFDIPQYIIPKLFEKIYTNNILNK